MKIKYKGKEVTLSYNENGSMFYLTNKHGDVVEWLCGRGITVTSKPNKCWVGEQFVDLLEQHGIVNAPADKFHPEERGHTMFDNQGDPFVFCNIIHPEFNDGGYSAFGDFCRSRLGQQCQYGSRYIDGRLEGYPALGEGLRFNNGHDYVGGIRDLDASDYHAVRIHRDDMDEFERRYKAYQEERLNG